MTRHFHPRWQLLGSGVMAAREAIILLMCITNSRSHRSGHGLANPVGLKALYIENCLQLDTFVHMPVNIKLAPLKWTDQTTMMVALEVASPLTSDTL